MISTRKHKNLMIALLMSAAFVTSFPLVAHSADDVVAEVNGDKILKKDVDAAIKTLPVQGADTVKVFPMVVDQIINEKLVDAEIAKSKIQDSDDFKKRLEVLRVQLAKQAYLEKMLKEKVSDGAVKSEYEKFKKENKGKEEIHARHIIVPTEEEAKQVIKDLDGGAKFEDLAKKRSSGPTAERGGDLGYFTKDDMIPEFSNAAFQLKPGSYTKEPVKTQFGWHVIYVEDKRERVVPAFKDVEAAIRNKLGQDAIGALIKDLRSKADIKIMNAQAPAAAEEKKKGG